ncbi:beta-ketoacyl [acyl carrier protein] synthase domain-containing protein [Fodinicola feengrottensis]|uniref:beta-ketoacyl [acyl carrier protein] synthase domain-containing protein n=1 Tax=Fodinicola feengrottensis TaxID=435914 RepID=UPI0036F2654A
MPASVADAEPDQLIALRVAAAAIADAGGESQLPDRDRVGIILGRGGYIGPGLARLDQRVKTAQQLVRTLAELVPALDASELAKIRSAFTDAIGPTHPDGAIGLVPNLAASRVANRLDLRGPAYTVDAACASSLVAVDQAMGELATGRCDVMLAGGVHHCHDITFWSVFSQLGALSAAEQIRPFDSRADGILIGEGTGVVVLKRLADAERDGDRVYAVIRGCAVASDGRAASLSSPDPGGQIRAVRQAWRAAGLDPLAPGSVGLIEAHGTATRAGDQAELTTLREVFGPPTETGPAVIGTVKSMIGHTMPAAGVAGLVKAALALFHQTLPPTLHCEQPNPELVRTRFAPIETARPWSTVDGQPRRAGVNAFGFGGINAHVVLEEGSPARSGRPVAVAEPDRVLLLSGEKPSRTGRCAGPTGRERTSAARTDRWPVPAGDCRTDHETARGGPESGGSAGRLAWPQRHLVQPTPSPGRPHGSYGLHLSWSGSGIRSQRRGYRRAFRPASGESDQRQPRSAQHQRDPGRPIAGCGAPPVANGAGCRRRAQRRRVDRDDRRGCVRRGGLGRDAGPGRPGFAAGAWRGVRCPWMCV